MSARTSRHPAPDHLEGSFQNEPVALIAGESDTLTTELANRLRVDGWQIYLEEPAEADHLDLVLWVGPRRPASWEAATAALSDALLLAGRVQGALEKCARSGRAAFMTISRVDGCFGLSGVESAERALLGGVPGLVKTLAIEAPTLFCRALDLAGELPDERCADLVLAELHDAEASLTEAGHGIDGIRRTIGLDAEPDGSSPGGPEVAPPTSDDLLVVTGGGRGVTASCAVGLARRYGCGLLLLGRTPLTDEPVWAMDIPEAELKAAIAAHLQSKGDKPTPRQVGRIFDDLVAEREIRDTLTAVRDAGACAEYIAVDITDPPAVEAALAAYRGRITGLMHGAGVLADQLIVDKRGEDVARVLAPKLAGLRGVLGTLEPERLRHVALFSSVAGFFGNRGQADYAMANQALNALACAVKREHPQASVTAINWGAWDGGMVTPELARMFAERGVELIPQDVGVELCADQFSAERSRDLVCVVGPEAPLSTPEPEPEPLSDGGLVVRRDLAPLAEEPVVTDHVIAGTPVMPATVAIGGLLNASTRVRPGVRVLTDFRVLKGVVWDDKSTSTLRLTIAADDESSGLDITAHDHVGTPRYRGIARTDLPPAAPVSGLPDPSGGEPIDPYTDGTLFHGPALRGVRRLVADDEDRLVLGCRLEGMVVADGAYGLADYRPELADLLLQAVLVWVRRHRGMASLPTGVGRVEVHAPLPAGAPISIVVHDVRLESTSVRCTVTACDADGTVLLRFRDVDAVCSPSLEAKFNHTEQRG